MIRLTLDTADPRAPVVRVEGTLDAPGAAALRQLLADARPAAVDLAGVGSIDEHGRAALVAARGEGVALLAPSLFIRTLLEEA
ncbi:MAG: hypothetical protein K1X88_09925 [Nannocystaceae bacterium]|nr:hypothetical protein [Nannocystaceae bacterium]